MLLACVGIGASIIGTFFVKVQEGGDPKHGLTRRINIGHNHACRILPAHHKYSPQRDGRIMVQKYTQLEFILQVFWFSCRPFNWLHY